MEGDEFYADKSKSEGSSSSSSSSSDSDGEEKEDEMKEVVGEESDTSEEEDWQKALHQRVSSGMKLSDEAKGYLSHMIA